MYLINDKTEAIKALQKMLDITPTGRIDTQSRGAIERITGRDDLSQVDYESFLEIKREAQRRRLTRYVANRLGVDVNRVEMRSYTRDEMRQINQLLSRAITQNRINAYLPKGTFFTKESAAAARILAAVFAMDESVGLDSRFMYRLLKNLDAYSLDNNSTL